MPRDNFDWTPKLIFTENISCIFWAYSWLGRHLKDQGLTQFSGLRYQIFIDIKLSDWPLIEDQNLQRCCGSNWDIISAGKKYWSNPIWPCSNHIRQSWKSRFFLFVFCFCFCFCFFFFFFFSYFPPTSKINLQKYLFWY